MFKHILLPTDGSELSTRAVDIGVELASRLGAQVFAFHVVPPFPATAYFAEIMQANEAAYTEEAILAAERYLLKVRQKAEAVGVPYSGSYEFSSKPSSAIVATAVKQACDVIVMASHGRRGLDKLLLGSETQKVLLESKVPVLVCR